MSKFLTLVSVESNHGNAVWHGEATEDNFKSMMKLIENGGLCTFKVKVSERQLAAGHAPFPEDAKPRARRSRRETATDAEE
jgi:hypothetical protein